MGQITFSAESKYVEIRHEAIFNFLSQASQTMQGVRRLDELLLSQLQHDGEQVYILHKNTGILAGFRGLFLPSEHDLYRVGTKEDDLENVLDGIILGDLTLLDSVEKYLQERHKQKSRIMYEQTGIKQTEAALVYALLMVERLKDGYNDIIANELKQFMGKNIFSDGVTSKNIPEKIWRNAIGSIHFHIGRDYTPPSTSDLYTSRGSPTYVCAYSIDNNNTKVYYVFKGVSDLIGLLKNSEDVHELSNTFTEHPNVSIITINNRDRSYKIEMDSKNGLRSMVLMGLLHGDQPYRVLTYQEFAGTPKSELLEVRFKKNLNLDYLVVFALDTDYRCSAASVKIEQKP